MIPEDVHAAGDSDFLLGSHAILWCADGLVHLVQDCQQSIHCLL